MPVTPDKLPPHSPEAEQGVIACCLLSPECVDECQLILKSPTAFYDLRHQTIYAALASMRQVSEPIDLITLCQKLRGQLEAVGGMEYLSRLPDTVPSAANLSSYLEIVAEKSKLRKLIGICTNALSKSFEDSANYGTLVNVIQHALISVGGEYAGTLDGPKISALLVDDLERRFNLQGKRSGLVTGFIDLDMLTDGLQFAEQTLIAARPSQGKTALACNVIEKVCFTDGLDTIFVTLEMSAAALSRRILSSWSKIPLKRLRSGTLLEGDSPKIAAFNAKLKASRLFIVDGVAGMNCNEVESEIRRICRNNPVKLVVIDYLQKIKPATKAEKRTYEVGEVSGVLKSLAIETKAAFFTLAQLNREGEKEKGRKPRMSDLADSGQIERDADTIGLIHRDRGDNNSKAEIIIAKQRDGELGLVQLRFNGALCRFENQVEN